MDTISSRRPDRVADYPRPPALVRCTLPVRVEVFGHTLAATEESLWVLETFHPPTVYLPPEVLNRQLLQPADGRSFCEWKGLASYWDLVSPGDGRRRRRAAWSYPKPTPGFAALAGWLSLYPAQTDGCRVNGAPVEPQPGGFYGGWILPWLQGPFKGDPAHPELV
ncbi:conserved domain protein [Cyanobium sp. PCC 7001]|uniref:DUF427 domain-containing protein n=1 Tax=Cyanobium sp. PCC 7001 TaxID=180281 RepID=UPI0001804F61|nr:DUF427 domain-containing protein [Cyanobium sp. PCC 7001]EDY37403.1 conserved domain protein [Cyanobium sp. PCC 7001]